MWAPVDITAIPTAEELVDAKYAIEEVESELKDALLLLEQARLRVANLEKDLQERKAWIAPIRRLPLDLLSLIFEFCGEDNWRTPLRISGVSRQWRYLVLATPRAWALPEVHKLAENKEALEHFFTYSQPKPSIMKHSEGSKLEDGLWDKMNPDIEALQGIIGDHFNSPCQTEEPMNHGVYARVFLYTLQNGLQVIARVILPVRESIKTESEIAAMDMVRARTSVPVPKVHLYCSTPHNPVRAEWVLMDYVPGKRFVDCFEELSYGQKNKTATDMALIMSEIFSFTSSHCGTLLCDQSLASNQRSRRYNDVDLGPIPTESHSEVSDGSFLIGPVNDVTFLAHRNIIPSAKCGPFSTERQFLEAFAYLGSPGTRSSDKLERGPFERLLEVYDVVRPKYPVSKGDLTTFHFDHGDLSEVNVLLDPKTGAITGIIDWEMAGFRPAWLVATCPMWFDDDSCRFVFEYDQDGPDECEDEIEDDTQLRQHFSSELEARNQELFQHNRQGVELRAMFYNLCNQNPDHVEGWLEKYEKYHWDVDTRGPFPFDLMRWIEDRFDLHEVSHR